MCKVKVCGIKDKACVPILNELTPDYVGFILSKGFKRSIEEQTFYDICGELNCGILRVGVFVNDDVKRIARLYNSGYINLAQLHGDEDEGYINELKNLCDVKVIKSVAVNCGKAGLYPNNCDYVLLDAYAPKERGGTGRQVEWRRYSEIDKPIFLAGGLTPQNVQEAIEKVRPFAVDCSGGVETDGKKDNNKIRQYILNARKCD
jgi:phosphoribosylanthranilate isomerase